MTFATTDMKHNATDEELVSLVLTGQTDLFETLVKRHEKRLHWTAIRILSNPYDAEDAVQESLTLAYTRLSQFQGKAAFGTWLTRITVNCCLALLRRQRRNRECSMEFETDGELATMEDFVCTNLPSPEESILWRDALTKVLCRVATMPSSVKPIFQLMLLEHSQLEIAESHRLTIAATKSRISRGRTMIRKDTRFTTIGFATRRERA